MKLDFVKLSPTQNMTLLVTSPVPRAQHCAVAGKLMAYDSIHAEQVGFLENPTLPGARIRLQMMGGEFCGNATMSLGAFLAFQDELPEGETAAYPLEVSGTDGIVNCRIKRVGSAWQGTVSMPSPAKIEETALPGGIQCPVVYLEGIAHAIVDAVALTRAQAEERIAGWCEYTNQEAFGIILRNGNSIEPLVYVRETGSAVWERGCGSGTAALGAWETRLSGTDVSMDVQQPGGVIRVNTAYNGDRLEITITGTVKIAAAGQAWID